MEPIRPRPYLLTPGTTMAHGPASTRRGEVASPSQLCGGEWSSTVIRLTLTGSSDLALEEIVDTKSRRLFQKVGLWFCVQT